MQNKIIDNSKKCKLINEITAPTNHRNLWNKIKWIAARARWWLCSVNRRAPDFAAIVHRTTPIFIIINRTLSRTNLNK